MSPDKKTTKTAAADTELPGGGNIDNIREILFGAQMRQYEKRFKRIEELLAKEASELRSEMQRRLEALETFAKQEFEDLGERVKTERDERSAAVTDLTKEVGSVAKDLAKKAGRLEEVSAKGIKELRAKLLEQSKSLSTEIRDRGESVLVDLSKEIEELRSEKTDRAALTSLFTEMALRLSDELRLPEGEDS